MLYQYKAISSGFVVLCPTPNIGHIRTTINSIKYNYKNAKYLCVLSNTFNEKDIEEVKKISDIHIGNGLFSSLLHLGLKNLPCTEWNLIVKSGSWLKSDIDKKYSYFMESEKDILFPLINKKIHFIDSNINGVFIHKNTSKLIGNFPISASIDLCKIYWAAKAVEKGCKFKAIARLAIS